MKNQARRDLLQDLEALRQDEEGDITEFVYDVIAPHAIQRAIDAEAREQKLREAYEKMLPYVPDLTRKALGLDTFMDSLYSKEETKPAVETREQQLKEARPIDQWHENIGAVLWWKFPIEEPPYCGSPLDSDWPDSHTHWTPIVEPVKFVMD